MLCEAWTVRSTRFLLTCAALGTLAALLIIGLSPLTTALALLSPPLYAVVASIHVLAPFTAAAWFLRPGPATLTALMAGLIAAPLTSLGPLLVIALVVPALAFDLVLVLGRHSTRRRAVWYGAALAAALAIIAISLPVIDERMVSPLLIALVVAARIVSYGTMALVARVLAVRLSAAGVRPPRRASPRDAPR